MSKFIAIEGVIGVGKTTLARLLQAHFGATVLLEVFEENPFLADFYGDRDRYAFQTQLFFLLSRYQQQKQAVPGGLEKGILISDYTFAKDELFAWLNLKDDELAMYGRVHSALSEKIRHPDLLVYLKAKHDTIMQRIALRDRPYERDMDPNYIRDLSAAYEAWLANLPDIPVLTIDVTELDFISRPNDVQVVADKIKTALAQQSAGQVRQVPKSATPAVATLQQGSLAKYQQFHQSLDEMKGFDQNPFMNFMGLIEEVGELSTILMRAWQDAQGLAQDGRFVSPDTAVLEAMTQYRAALRAELADLLAYTLKLANYTGIDLEEAYLEKMRENINRHWEFS
jgi:deoxyguanosine kinase